MFSRFMQHLGQMHVSAVAVGELYVWALRAKSPAGRMSGLLDLLNDVTVLDITADVGRRFGEERARQLDAGSQTPEMDLLIAATALQHGLTLVTHNIRHYADVRGLGIVDWLAP